MTPFQKRCGLLAVCTFALTAILTGAAARSRTTTGLELLKIRKSDLRIDYQTTGQLHPISSLEVVSECRWPTRILSLLHEGTWVQAGDVVCVLESTEIEEYIRAREVPLIRARARLDAAVQDEELLRSSNERRLSQAEFQLQSAINDEEIFERATAPEKIRVLMNRQRMFTDQLALAEEEHAQAEDLARIGVASQRSLDESRVKLHTSREQLRKLEAELHFLREFVHPRDTLRNDFRRNQAERNVLRTEILNSLAETRNRLETLSAERIVDIYTRTMNDARDSLKACTIRAPRDGQVLYSNSWGDLSRGSKVIEVGSSVHYQQAIFEIPDETSFRVDVPIHEALISRVHEGMPVEVTLRGYESVRIAGRIVRIADFPVPQSRFAPDVRVYRADVLLEPAADQKLLLRTRMDADVEITLKHFRDVIKVPRDAVVGLAGTNFVWKMHGTDLVPCAVDPGEANDTEVIIRGGLEVGDTVVVRLPDDLQQALYSHIENQQAIAFSR